MGWFQSASWLITTENSDTTYSGTYAVEVSIRSVAHHHGERGLTGLVFGGMVFQSAPWLITTENIAAIPAAAAADLFQSAPWLITTENGKL